MSKKTLVVIALVVGLAAYGAYIVSILRPYFAKVELKVAWELNFSSVPLSQMHIGDAGTVFLITEESEFIAISPQGQELYRFAIPDLGYSFGFDGTSDDTLWIATITHIDSSMLPNNGQYITPTNPNGLPTPAANDPSQMSPYTARLVGVLTDGSTPVDLEFEAGGIISNLWCMDDQIYFMDSGQNLNCYDVQGAQVWVKNFPRMVDFSKGGSQLFLDCGTDVVALNAAGDELWRTPVGSGNGLGSWNNWSSAGNRLCLLDDLNYIHVVDFGGQYLWSVELPYSFGPFAGSGYTDPSARIHTDHTVYALSRDANLHKYSPDGDKLWHFKVGSNPSGLYIGTDGTTYVHNQNKGLLAVSARGKLLWRDERFVDYKSRLQKIGDNGLLYLVQDDKLMALKLPGK